MRWKKFTIQTTTKAEELVSNLLMELGIDSIEVEDKIPISQEDKKKMFIDILPEQQEDDGVANITFYSEETKEVTELLEKIEDGMQELALFTDIGTGLITISETEDTDWINNWKEFFKPFRIDEDIIIKPTWESLENIKENDMIIEIDPGTAFGTGSHETTKLCVLNLKKYLKKEDWVLDLGSGSGILSIISRKLGASYVIGTDIDSNAVLVSAENCKVNHLDQAVLEAPPYSLKGIKSEEENIKKVFQAAKTGCGFFCCDVISDKKARKAFGNQYDIVVANILADVIIPLSAVAKEFLKQGGYFISSGIIDIKAQEVKEAILLNGFDIIEETKMGDWFSYIAKKL